MSGSVGVGVSYMSYKLYDTVLPVRIKFNKASFEVILFIFWIMEAL